MSSIDSSISISVILPVYNAEEYIEEAITSILNQTFQNFELICINDGSTDGSLDIIRNFSDKRMRVVSRENRGLIATLNEAIGYATSRYIARMDADDVALPDRFEKQIKFMLKHKLGVVGSSYRYIDAKGTVVGVRRLTAQAYLTSWLLDFGSTLCHPSVLIDKYRIAGELYYSSEAEACEDYELWLRLRHSGVKMANVPDILLNYRVLSSSISRSESSQQALGSAKYLSYYSPFIKTEEDAFYILVGRKSQAVRSFYRELKITYLALKNVGTLRAMFVLSYFLLKHR